MHGHHVCLTHSLPTIALQATAEVADQAVEAPLQPDLEEPLHAPDSSSQPGQPLHSDEPSSQAAHQQQPAVLQQPVLALLSSGLPPILLGSFQGDMQRARIILEAAGFLVPLDISSSLLPPGLSQSLPQQQAVHAEHAELGSDQAAAHKDGTSSADDAAGMELPADVQLASAQEGPNQGSLLPCMPSTLLRTGPWQLLLCCVPHSSTYIKLAAAGAVLCACVLPCTGPLLLVLCYVTSNSILTGP